MCFGCNAHLIRGEQHLCTVCRNNLPFTEYNFRDENPVDRLFYGRTKIEKAASFLFFTEMGIVRQIIHYLKYKNQEQIGEFLGNWYGRLLRKDGLKDAIDVVVPIPLHRRKRRRRGYNQVSKFARSIAGHLDAEFLEHALLKTADTKTQTKKGRLGRWYAGKPLYKLADATALEHKNVLLVDDVITTGATMEICAETLHQTKGISIYVASMAVVPQFQ